MSAPNRHSGSSTSNPPPTTPADPTIERALSRLARRAALALWWERLWPALVPPLCVVALFVAASWMGLFDSLPHGARLVALAGFALAALASLVPLARIAPPAVADKLRRIDRDSEARHGLASVWADRLGAGARDSGSVALWHVHRLRVRDALARARVAWPRPGLVQRDPRALRMAPLLLLVGAFFVAGPDRMAKIASALDPTKVAGAAVEARIDGWIDPPAYTRIPPIVIDFAKAGPERFDLRAPVGSTLVLRWPEGSGIAAQATDGLKSQGQATVSAGVSETRWRLSADANVAVTGGARERHLAVAAIPNEPPTIRIVGEPKTNIHGTVTLSYAGDDEYGIASVETRFADPTLHAHPILGSHPLVAPPVANLPPPHSGSATQPSRDTFDLSADPWAGTDVTMRLLAKNEAGLEATSDPVTLTLPEHPFTKPLARALVEQRRKLALDADQRPKVQEALYALLIAPERFMPQAGIYVGLHLIATHLAQATNDDQLRSVVSDLWNLALVVEGSGPTKALDAVRAAEQALKDALANGASKEEIDQRMAELRQALDRYMRELADRARDNPNMKRADRDQLVLSQRDLESMLDKLGEMAKNGERDRAERMLEQLQNMLDNLQTAEGDQNGAGDQQATQEEQALDEMSELLRRELELRDDTQSAQRKRQSGEDQGQPNSGDQDQAQQDQGQPGGHGQGMQQGQGGGQDQTGGLSERQQRLRQRLEELGKKLGRMGSDEAGKNLGDAGQAMRQAEGELGKGDTGSAAGSEGRAIDAMRKGMNSLSDQLAQQQQQQDGQQGPDGRGHGRSRMVRGGLDPLGRSPDRNDDDYGAEDYDNGNGIGRRNGLQGNVAERARQILEELRRRLGDPSRAQEELDYIERLLKTQ